ncbi:multicopper oxidase family protein [Pendulispora albinea]|uniref:Copper oxidase n=1 Tax=Pendulispora albinea TaxID=2741071 RepID=A0ABZ2MC97_9BACT
MISRRDILSSAALLGGAVLAAPVKRADAALPPGLSQPTATPRGPLPYTPVITPNGGSLPWIMDGNVKVFHLVAEEVKREFAPGMIVNAWGYNGLTPGPTIEAVEGDRVRIFLTNRLPERTSAHWHGIILPNGMDGVAGLLQPHIEPGETYVYEFVVRKPGTFMYHPHSDEMVQMALGMMGFFIVHPRVHERVDRDFAIMLMEWAIAPGTARPNPAVMTDFNIFTFNSRVWPGTAPLVVKKNDRVRIRLGNLSMDNHPIHIHGHNFEITGTDGGRIRESARWPETTVDVPVGTTRDIEFLADNPGDWPFHCHKSHHTMNAMSHEIPNLIGVKQGSVEQKVRKILPGYMAMGENGMGNMMDMGRPKNTLPMMAGDGPFGPIEMGGMFTVIKIREGLTDYSQDPGWYKHPEGTVAHKVDPSKVPPIAPIAMAAPASATATSSAPAAGTPAAGTPAGRASGEPPPPPRR